jgi:hypothetical protein
MVLALVLGSTADGLTTYGYGLATSLLTWKCGAGSGSAMVLLLIVVVLQLHCRI